MDGVNSQLCSVPKAAVPKGCCLLLSTQEVGGARAELRVGGSGGRDDSSFVPHLGTKDRNEDGV